ncbi:MAG: hypothetical protein HDT25_04920 [Ruminococcus sp.]|nr:hypothetical protein [Ruminococcus sp.]
MIKNVYTNTAIGNGTLNEATEYKIGHTTYKVTMKFNIKGESLNDILARLIRKEVQKSA